MVIALGLAGCRGDVHHELEERAANEIVAALGAHGIVGDKVREGAGWTVTVPRAQQSEAVAVVAALGLPRTFDASPEESSGGLVPSEADERRRRERQVEGRLASTLAALDGVREAHVHVSLPVRRERLGAREDVAAARASVVLVHRADQAAPDDDVIRAVVAGAVEELSEDQVAVVRSAIDLPPSRVDEVVAWGPLAVSSSSVRTLRALLLGGSGIVLVLAGLVMALVVSARRQA